MSVPGEGDTVRTAHFCMSGHRNLPYRNPRFAIVDLTKCYATRTSVRYVCVVRMPRMLMVGAVVWTCTAELSQSRTSSIYSLHDDINRRQTRRLRYFPRRLLVEVARWRNGYSAGLAIIRSYSRQRCVTTLGKLFRPMCLCHHAV